METVRNVVYVIVGLAGLFILVVAVVCVSVHIYHCCSHRRRKRSDTVDDACSRPSASSAAVNCQYVTLQMNDGLAAATMAVPTAEVINSDSVELPPIGQNGNMQQNVKPPSYDEVMGYQ